MPTIMPQVDVNLPITSLNKLTRFVNSALELDAKSNYLTVKEGPYKTLASSLVS
jgi:hypothetical protein